jgi:hypothetical protein
MLGLNIGDNNNNKLWHQHYGHLSMKTLQKTKQHVARVSLSTDEQHKCHDCITSKIICCPISLIYISMRTGIVYGHRCCKCSWPIGQKICFIVGFVLVSVEMQDAQVYIARCTTLSTSSFAKISGAPKLIYPLQRDLNYRSNIILSSPS